jgi:ubiquitin carboxyl-terminal hydrolase 36/42
MIEITTSNRRVATPKDLVVRLKKLWKQYRFGRQEDSHEFLVMFLQGILKASFGNNTKLINKYESLSMIYRIFAGKQRSQIKCLSCGYLSNSFEDFLALSLEISKAVSFEDCIRNFCTPETLDGSNKYACSGCSRKTKATKRMSFSKPPRILTVQFLRFTMTGRKIDKYVKFPK